MSLRTYNIYDLELLNPCKSPLVYLPIEWTGTLVDLLDLPDLSFKDKCWLMERLLSYKTQRLLAINSVESLAPLAKSIDPRTSQALLADKEYLMNYGTYEAVIAAHVAAADACIEAYEASNDYYKCLYSYYAVEFSDVFFSDFWHLIQYVDRRSSAAKLIAFKQIIYQAGD